MPHPATAAYGPRLLLDRAVRATKPKKRLPGDSSTRGGTRARTREYRTRTDGSVRMRREPSRCAEVRRCSFERCRCMSILLISKILHYGYTMILKNVSTNIHVLIAYPNEIRFRCGKKILKSQQFNQHQNVFYVATKQQHNLLTTYSIPEDTPVRFEVSL